MAPEGLALAWIQRAHVIVKVRERDPSRVVVQTDGVPRSVTVNGAVMPRSATSGDGGWTLDDRGFVVVDRPDTFEKTVLEIGG